MSVGVSRKHWQCHLHICCGGSQEVFLHTHTVQVFRCNSKAKHRMNTPIKHNEASSLEAALEAHIKLKPPSPHLCESHPPSSTHCLSRNVLL